MRYHGSFERARLAIVRACPWQALGALCLTSALVVSGACGSAPSSTDPHVGSWQGSIADRDLGTGTLRLDLRSGSRLEGTWTAQVGGASLSGTATSDLSNGSQRTFAVGCGSPGSTVGSSGSMVWATAVGGGSLTGSYISARCGGLVGGTFELRRP